MFAKVYERRKKQRGRGIASGCESLVACLQPPRASSRINILLPDADVKRENLNGGLDTHSGGDPPIAYAPRSSISGRRPAWKEKLCSFR